MRSSRGRSHGGPSNVTLGTGRIRGVSPIQTQRPPRQGAPLRASDRARGGALATRGHGGLVGRAGGQIVAPSSAGSANGSANGSATARRSHKVDHSRALRALGLGGMRGRDESSAPSGGLAGASVPVLSAADRVRSAPTNLRHSVRVLNARAACPHLVATALPIMSYRVTDMYLAVLVFVVVRTPRLVEPESRLGHPYLHGARLPYKCLRRHLQPTPPPWHPAMPHRAARPPQAVASPPQPRVRSSGDRANHGRA